MSFLPRLRDIKVKTEVLSKFAGLNRSPVIKDAEFCKMRNMTSDGFPVLSPRKRRHCARRLSKPNGLYMHSRLAWVDGTKFYYNGEEKGTVADSAKSMVGMGAYIAVFPDKKLFNTADGSFESMENSVTTSGRVSWTLTDKEGSPYTYTSSSSAPSSPSGGQYWLDTSQTPHVLKQYSSQQGAWASVETTYVKLSSEGIGSGFSELDTVSISGMSEEALNGDFSLQKREQDNVVVTAIIDAAGSQTSAATLKRKVPDMDFITESGNRLWGCSNADHEIYACRQGDPKNWYSYLGIASDSYAATIGTKGDFTGAVTHLGDVTFFKEDVIQRVYGSKPSNFQLNDTCVRGVEKGSEHSAAMVNETLFYKSKSDVCCYSASLPQSVSRQLGAEPGKNASGGAMGRKYYLSVQNAEGEWELLVYDTEYGIWHREDETHALFFAGGGSELYFVDADGYLWNVNGSTDYDDPSAACEEGEVEWFCETGSIGMDMPDSKYVSKLRLRLEAGAGSTVRIEASYDEGSFRTLYTARAGKKRSVTVPVVPRRCDTMKLRISGRGPCKIYSIAKTVEQGSDI